MLILLLYYGVYIFRGNERKRGVLKVNETQKQGFDKQDYDMFVHPYQTAGGVVMVHLTGLRRDLELSHKHKPIHHISCRFKTMESIEGKLRRRGLPGSWESAQEYLTDIAGIRVLCYYKKDIYLLAKLLKKQLDAIVVKESDYIANPKPNGYRSFHMVLGVAVYGAESKQYYPVEIQIRTLAMDFWASMEHQLCYKSQHINHEEMTRQFREYSDSLEQMQHNLENFYDFDTDAIM